MSLKELEGQLARWLKRLQQYEFEIIHRKGELHRNADGLSKRSCLNDGLMTIVLKWNLRKFRQKKIQWLALFWRMIFLKNGVEIN